MKRLIRVVILALAVVVSFGITADVADANQKTQTTRSSSPTWE